MSSAYLDGARSLAIASNTEDLLPDAVVHVRELRRPNFILYEVLQLDGGPLPLLKVGAHLVLAPACPHRSEDGALQSEGLDGALEERDALVCWSWMETELGVALEL